MGESSMDYTAASSVHGLGFSPACIERSVSYASPPVRSMGTEYQCSTMLSYHCLCGHTMLRVFLLAWWSKLGDWAQFFSALALDLTWGIGCQIQVHLPTLHHVYWREFKFRGRSSWWPHCQIHSKRDCWDQHNYWWWPTFESLSTLSHLCSRIEKMPIFCHCLCL